MTVSLVPSVLRRLAGGHRHAQGGLPALSWFPLPNSEPPAHRAFKKGFRTDHLFTYLKIITE